MDNYRAVMVAEGVVEATDEEDYIAAWQHLVDTGMVWRLQGFFGRTASELIAQGILEEPA